MLLAYMMAGKNEDCSISTPSPRRKEFVGVGGSALFQQDVDPADSASGLLTLTCQNRLWLAQRMNYHTAEGPLVLACSVVVHFFSGCKSARNHFNPIQLSSKKREKGKPDKIASHEAHTCGHRRFTGHRQRRLQGFDISNWQKSVDFEGAYNSGARFVIIKATEGTGYRDPSFSCHYTNATNAHFIRGGYHFARPDSASGAEQASYFLAHGGGWTSDGITLPGMLDLEGNLKGDQCYGLSASSMVSWIQDFVDTYKGKTGRYPMIYTSPSWWQSCTGDSGAFAGTCPLVMARWADSPGTAPGGWTHTIWQYTDKYEFGGDGDLFNGDEADLRKLALG